MHRDAAPFEFCDGELKVEFENVWESLLATARTSYPRGAEIVHSTG
jgi:hypothetical protein